MDIQTRHFYGDVITHLEEIIAAYTEQEFEEDFDESDDESVTEMTTLTTFIKHIEDALIIAQEQS